jgi:protein-S-isoprenylcysteine O-methyltransferase Ste14
VTILQQIVRSGDVLFRWRSYLPLLLLPVLAAGLAEARYPLGSHALDLAWEIGSVLIAALGVAIRVYTVGTAPRGTSGRNTRAQKAATLNTTGPYSIVRHPLYVANAIIAFGLSLFCRAWFVPVIVVLATLLYYERIAAREEEFLESKFGDAFRAWAAVVPAAIPSFSRFAPAPLPFSWRTALVREHYAVVMLLTVAFLMDLAGDYAATGTLVFDPVWTTLFGLGALFFALMRVLKKRTNLFRMTTRRLSRPPVA